MLHLGKEAPYPGKEYHMQKAAYRMCRFLLPDVLTWHTPNGGHRDSVEAKLLMADGVVSGVPDLFVASPRGRFAGLFIELKVKGGAVSPDQARMMDYLTNQCFAVAVVWNLDALETLLRWYASLETIRPLQPLSIDEIIETGPRSPQTGKQSVLQLGAVASNQ